MDSRPLPNGQFQLPVVPAIVCAAFSVEVGFKAIILSEGGKASGHALADLFTKLSPDIQDFIVQETGCDRAAFDSALVAVSSSFVNWRYVYEQPSAQINIDFLSRLAAATQKASARTRASA